MATFFSTRLLKPLITIGGYTSNFSRTTEYSINKLQLSIFFINLKKPHIIWYAFTTNKIFDTYIKKDSKIPFGPYLAAGSLISLFTISPSGDNYILNWYYLTMF